MSHPYRRAMAAGRLAVAQDDAEQLQRAWLAAQDRAADLRRQYVDAAIEAEHAAAALRHAEMGLACGPDCWACGQVDTAERAEVAREMEEA